jgi:hypothetical protein
MKWSSTVENTSPEHISSFYKNKTYESILVSKPEKLLRIILLIGIIAAGLLFLLLKYHTQIKLTPPNLTESSSSAKPEGKGTYFNLPMVFEANYGQANDKFKYIARSTGYTVSLLSNSVQITLQKPLPGSGMQQNFLNVSSQKKPRRNF